MSYLGLVEAFRDARYIGRRAGAVEPTTVVRGRAPTSTRAVLTPRRASTTTCRTSYVRAGFVAADDHAVTQHAVRRVDNRYLCNPRYFIAAAEEVKDRLARFNGLVDRVGVYHPGSDFAERLLARSLRARSSGIPLCVTRHEFPKRSELFVQAMHEVTDVVGVCVGSGGRLPFVRDLDARLSAPELRPDLPAEQLWLNRGEPGQCSARLPAAGDPGGRVDFRGFVDDARARRAVPRRAVRRRPALLEDYGLTAIEAMACGKPLIVCADGGGLTRFVEDGVDRASWSNRPVAAIATAIRRLVDDPRPGAAARQERA